MSKRILYLTPTGILSGGERVTLDIAQEMKSRGYTVTYAGLEGNIREFAEQAGVPFLKLEKFSLREVWRAVRQFDPDLIHTMDYRASFFSTLSGVPTVAHLHSNCPWLRNLCPNALAFAWVGLRAKKLICVSDSIMEDFLFRSFCRGKDVTLLNVVDIQRVARMAEEPVEDADYDVGFFGRLTEPKQPVDFVRIVAGLREHIPDVKAVMIGEGDLRNEVEGEITKLGLWDHITMTGFLSNPFPVAKQCKLILMPSAWEGFPLTAVESLSLGKPMLARPVSGLRDIITEENGGICRSIEDFVARSRELLSDVELYERIAIQARKSAEPYGDKQRYYDVVEGIYHGIE